MSQESNNLYVPENYQSFLSPRETEVAIKKLKYYFEETLSQYLNLTKVSAPLIIKPESGLNDNLNGTESAVTFTAKEIGNSKLEIPHSLAKWKRYALKSYGFSVDEGLYTVMNAIRKDEDFSNLHSIYVDQWDWERVINKNQRSIDFLKDIVNEIFTVLKLTENYISSVYPTIEKMLPENIYFITSQELEDKYPHLSPKDREHEICKEHGAVFIIAIGHVLNSGTKHDGRAPDYDDWNLNGDILLWYPLLNRSIELSSMGIRVDKQSLESQLKLANAEYKKELMFHKLLLNEQLPLTIGGGIGQSRICMYFLRKAHIGEVQSSLWDQNTIQLCSKSNIKLL
jgi:aspartate--ammonia ligase